MGEALWGGAVLGMDGYEKTYFFFINVSGLERGWFIK
jgi:hypothetical protein